MDEQSFRKIVKEVVDEAIEPVKKDLESVKETLEDHTQRLVALSGDIEQLHMDVKGIRDQEGMAHSRNKREIDEIKKHLNLPIIPDRPEI